MGYNRPGYICLHLSCATTNPNDSTTYYLGDNSGLGTTTSDGISRIVMPVQGVIRAVYLCSRSSTTAGSNEAWAWLIRLNATTDYTFDSQSLNTNERIWSNTGLAISVAAGDYIEFKTTTPAWATNPEGFRAWGVVLVETA